MTPSHHPLTHSASVRDASPDRFFLGRLTFRELESRMLANQRELVAEMEPLRSHLRTKQCIDSRFTTYADDAHPAASAELMTSSFASPQRARAVAQPAAAEAATADETAGVAWESHQSNAADIVRRAREQRLRWERQERWLSPGMDSYADTRAAAATAEPSITRSPIRPEYAVHAAMQALAHEPAEEDAAAEEAAGRADALQAQRQSAWGVAQGDTTHFGGKAAVTAATAAAETALQAQSGAFCLPEPGLILAAPAYIEESDMEECPLFSQAALLPRTPITTTTFPTCRLWWRRRWLETLLAVPNRFSNRPPRHLPSLLLLADQAARRRHPSHPVSRPSAAATAHLRASHPTSTSPSTRPPERRPRGCCSRARRMT